MKISWNSMGVVVAIVGVLLLSTMSAGCILGNYNVLPSEVNNRGSIIYINQEYVSADTIEELLLRPDNYAKNLVDAVDQYMPATSPVIEVGVGTGVVMAYVSKQLNKPKQHIALEPNPNLIPELTKTIEKNNLIVTLRQEAVAYPVGEPYVQLTIDKDLTKSFVTLNENSETVSVPATSISDLLASSTFATDTNVTLILETADLLPTILTNEPEISQNVRLIIDSTPEMDVVDEQAYLYSAMTAGYKLKYVSDVDSKGYRVHVFERLDSEQE